MAMAENALPDLNALDKEALKTLVLAQQSELTAQQTQIENLKLMIVQLKRMHFGPRSEKLSCIIGQLELQLEDLETGEAESETERSQPTIPQPSAEPACKPARRSLPAKLPRETEILAPTQQCCPDCGGQLRHLGEDVSETLEYVPARFKVIRTVRPKLSCGTCARIVQEPAPSRPIDHGVAGPGLLAHVLTAKYSDHLPLYRQAEIYAREGLELERSTLAGWVGGASRLMAPLVEAVKEYVLSAGKLHGDDVPVPVLAPGNGKTNTGRLWTYVRDDRPAGSESPPAVWFAYSPDRRGEHPARHLKTFRGILQADAYAGFNQLFEQNQVAHAACWAHFRRKFNDIYQAHQSPIAAEALQRIAQLYVIENEIRGRLPDQRREVRNARARLLIESLGQWFQQTLRKLSQKSDWAKAINYALRRWPALLRYCQDGHLEIDNNAAERSLRPVALGRKNYLFTGSDAGGERAAAIYTLIGSAKLNGLDPEAYLAYVLRTIADHPINRFSALLPWNVNLEPASSNIHAA